MQVSVYVEHLAFETFGQPGLHNQTLLTGRTRTTTIQAPRGFIGGYLFNTDSLKVYADANKTYGSIDLGVGKYLYADLQSRKRLVVQYRSEGPIQIEQKVNNYGVVVPAK